MLKSCSFEKNIRDSLRIVDLKGKKDSSTKISICSNKPAKENERGSDDKQTAKKGLGRISINLFNPTSRTVKPIITIQTGREDKLKLKEKSGRVTTIHSSVDQNSIRNNNSLTVAQNEVIESIRAQFQQRIKTIITQNAKTVQELRSMLGLMQQRIAQQEQIISHLMSAKHKRLNTEETTTRSSNHEQSTFYSSKPSVESANIELLWSKTHYLQTNLRTVIERLAENDEVKEKLSIIEQGFYYHLSQRVARCWTTLQRYCVNLDNKCQQIESSLQNFIRNAPIVSQCQENTDKFREKFNGLALQLKNIQQDVACFKQRMQPLQNSVASGTQGNYYLEDDDQFFYPTTSRRTPSEASLLAL